MNKTQRVNVGLNYDRTLLISYDLYSTRRLVLDKVDELFALKGYSVNISFVVQKASYPPISNSNIADLDLYRLEILLLEQDGNYILPSYTLNPEDINSLVGIRNYILRTFELFIADIAVSDLYSVAIDSKKKEINLIVGVNISNLVNSIKRENDTSSHCWIESVNILNSSVDAIPQGSTIHDSLKLMRSRFGEKEEKFWDAVRK